MKIVRNFLSNALVIVAVILLSILLSACGPANSPAEAVEEYLTALAEKDQTSAVASSCAAWEEDALAEGASFINVEVSLDGLECQVIEQNNSEASVECSGKYIFSYDAGENQELDVGSRIFSAVLEGNEWRMCGYQE